MIDGKRDEGKGSVLSGVGMTVFIGKALVLSVVGMTVFIGKALVLSGAGMASEAKKKKMADQTP